MADVIFIVLIGLIAYAGAKRGFMRMLMGLSSTVLSLIVSTIIYRPVALLLSNSPIGDAVRTYMENFVSENAGGMTAALLQNSIAASSQLVIDAISFAAVIILSKIIISMVVSAMNIVSKLPVIHQANSFLGLVVGIISGVLVCYIAIGVIGIAAQHGNLSDIAEAIENSVIASLFYEGNVITGILS